MDHRAAFALATVELAAVAVVAIVRPGIVRRVYNSARHRRLDRLAAGDEEAYFEERRALEAYKIRRLWAVRLLGGLYLLSWLFILFAWNRR